MRMIVLGLIVVAGIFNLMLGLSFLLNPVNMASQFALDPRGIQGLASLRADFTAFFLVVGSMMIWGAWRRLPTLFLTPMLLLGIAFLGRCLSLILDGAADTAFLPMGIEAAQVLLLLWGRNMLRQS